MKILYFMAINILALLAMVGAYMYVFINNIEHTNSIYFWIMAYTCVIGCSIIGMNCRNQLLRLEEVVETKLQLDPTDEEIASIAEIKGDVQEKQGMDQEQDEDVPSKKRFFKKRA